MGIQQLQLGCVRCQAITPHNVQKPNHLLHLLLTVFTAGLWLIVWIIIAAGKGSTPACVRCGQHNAAPT